MTDRSNTKGLSDEDRVALTRIRKAFFGMPYGGLANFTHPTSLTLVEIADNLESLVKVLQSVSEDHAVDLERFRRQEAAIGGLRSFLSLLKEDS